MRRPLLALGPLLLVVLPASWSPASGVDVRCGIWAMAPTANPGEYNHLVSVSGTSPRADVWAVGEWSPTLSDAPRTLVEHRGRRGWRVASSPGPGEWSTLADVQALGPKDAWAVGTYGFSGFGTGAQSLGLHWDGTTWSQADLPTVDGEDDFLNGVAFATPADGWAVGELILLDSRLVMPFAQRWDGSAWTIVTMPIPPSSTANALLAAGAIAPSDVWAVGYSADLDGVAHPLAEHWDGTAWTIVDVPDPSGGTGILRGIAALATDDVWAVGSPSSGTEVLVEHWDGWAWRVVEAPEPGPTTMLFDVAAVSANDVWAVGWTIDRGHLVPLMERWDGDAWAAVRDPALDAVMRGVAAFPSGQVWSVGSRGNDAVSQRFKEC